MHATWLYTLGAVVFVYVLLDAVVLLAATASLASPPRAAPVILVGAIIVASALQVRYCWFLTVGRGGGLPAPAWTGATVATAAAVWGLGLFIPGMGLFTAIPLWMAVNLVAALLQTGPRRLVLVAGVIVTALHPLLAAAVLERPFAIADYAGVWLLIFYVMLLPAFVLSSLWWWDIVVTLDRHRAVAAELAVAQERLRFASDLHDIQGHHLQVIALKTELAERLMSTDPEAAREHVRASRLIAKQAMEETRSLIAGYRHIGLDQELENAREVLAAAGAECDLRVGALPAGTDEQRVLALVVREATTNILRHSEATRVWIQLDVAGQTGAGDSSGDVTTMLIGNNGLAPADSPAPRGDGSGLAGLRGRLSAVGGSLETAVDAAADSFELRVRVHAPVGAQA